MASATKACGQEFYADRGPWPTDDGSGAGGATNQLGWTALPSGKYVDNIAVTGGDIVITYGVNANPALSGTDVVLHAGFTDNGDVVWVCQDGTAIVPGRAPPRRWQRARRRPTRPPASTCRRTVARKPYHGMMAA